MQTYCKALGIAFCPRLTDQEQASTILTRWLQILNCAAVWSGGMLKFIPYGDAAIAAGNVDAPDVQVACRPRRSGSGATPPPSIVVCGAAEFVVDGGVKYAFTGAALSLFGASAPSAAGTYGISPAGTYLFAAGDEDQVVAITYHLCRFRSSYSPNLTPIYNLTDLDFVDETGNKDPVQVYAPRPVYAAQ